MFIFAVMWCDFVSQLYITT